MADTSKIPAAQITIEDPPEYAAAPGQATTLSGSGKPPEPVSQDLRGQLKWNEQRSGESEAAPSSSDAVTQANVSVTGFGGGKAEPIAQEGIARNPQHSEPPATNEEGAHGEGARNPQTGERIARNPQTGS